MNHNEPLDASVVGRNIRFWREERRMSLRALAARAGTISSAGIGQYERGLRRIPIESLLKIAAALDVDVVKFLEEPPARHAGELDEADR